MIPIPHNFNRNGYKYILVLTGKRALIYAQHGYGKIIAYEVIKIRYRPERKIKGKILLESLRLPSDNDFGYHAWSFGCFSDPEKALIKAKEKFQELERLTFPIAQK